MKKLISALATSISTGTEYCKNSFRCQINMSFVVTQRRKKIWYCCWNDKFLWYYSLW